MALERAPADEVTRLRARLDLALAGLRYIDQATPHDGPLMSVYRKWAASDPYTALQKLARAIADAVERGEDWRELP